MSASTIISPNNSFVRFNVGKTYYQNECYAEPINKCLPVLSPSEIQFQFYFTNITGGTLRRFFILPVPVNDETDEYCENLPYETIPIGNPFDPEIPCTIPNTMPDVIAEIEPEGEADPFRLGIVELEDWSSTDWPVGINEGDCFRYIVIQSNVDINGCALESFVIGCSNCFYRIDEECDTSKVQYRCNENQFGFNYEVDTNFVNIIRLPLYLYAPQYPSEKKGYQKSNGQFLKLSERINEEWQLKTDYMVREFHERLVIALAHDSLDILNANKVSAGPYFHDSEYNIEWSEDERMIDATAETIVKVSASNNRINSNCS